jgi:DNA-binding transcriptional MerR regulator
MAQAEEPQLTIDELAREAGVTVRTIRDHQTRGLLSPPQVRGRLGYYGDEHLARLKLIREFQADGFNLTAIQRILERSPESSEEILGFREALRRPFEHEQPVVMTDDELIEAFGGVRYDWAFEDAQRLGVIVPLGEGRWEVPSPSVVRAGSQTVALGIPLEAALKLIARVKRNTDDAARAFTELFIEFVWRPHDFAGQPGDEWEALQGALTQLRPLAGETVLGLFGPSMSAAVDEAVAVETEREKRTAGGSAKASKARARRRKR